MDDGDLGDNIQQETDVIEESVSHDRRIGNDDAHLAPNRWWFASSAFPMIAGTLGPVASAFSICALVRPWRQHYIPSQPLKEADFVADPVWLTVINAIQLGMAIISNIFLLLNMTRRVRFTIAQPLTIIGWYISAILLISLLATASGPLYEGFGHPKNELIWSQAFYYGIWAAILYFVDASLMVITFYGASVGHYPNDFNLTPSQRTLMLQTIMFLLYLLVGAVVFSNIEDWNYLDTVYWADVTLFTVGFGDFTAQTNLGRALMMPYALVGVISLGLVIGSIRSLVLERGKKQVDARMEEKKRRRIVRTMTKKGQDEVLEPIREPRRQDSTVSQDGQSNNQLPATEYERRKAEFDLMRKIQAQTSYRRRWVAMGISTGVWLILWLLGAYIFVKCEEDYQGWKYFDGFYFCFVSLTTIGYGDVTPISNAGKSFFVFWSLLALPTMTILISNAGDTVVKLIRDGTLRLGNVTILPGEDNFKSDLKYIINKCTFGLMYTNYTEPPPLNREKKPASKNSSTDTSDSMTKKEEDKLDEHARGRPKRSETGEDDDPADPRPGQERNHSTFTARVRRSLSRLRDAHKELPTGTDFHFLLISEIQVLMNHLKSSKPHKYSFEEWAWYLKLIGEDESNAETHGKAQPSSRHHHHHRHPRRRKTNETAEGVEKDVVSDDTTAWSWVGNRSPLMGSQEETEWILDRLLERLRESLSAEGKKQATADARRALGADRRRSPDDTHHRKKYGEKENV
ncbi:TOK1-voltage-gated outward-rectifying K+ channel [Fusarium tjaetaba]|uniref:TOK1-voltage-gated outward-rectifying K+ channel n=1 Tax=Fusarium tjaetaba TaxID=1567544 RepID=A0A8H5QHE0_9HYPO|nr:TOK1-voltage-gated outward-rectifying K+ channel [Fusarium tjaetaba]KAF5614789.1 TOK1-voltage-gated outward-rectifying K+ channel [Fusarium tjaetaba]